MQKEMSKDIDEQILEKHYKEVYETAICIECKGYVNLFSEGETYNYSEDDDGNPIYWCENCLKGEKCDTCGQPFYLEDLNECDNCDELTCDSCNEEHGHMGGISNIGFEEDDGEY